MYACPVSENGCSWRTDWAYTLMYAHAYAQTAGCEDGTSVLFLNDAYAVPVGTRPLKYVVTILRPR